MKTCKGGALAVVSVFVVAGSTADARPYYRQDDQQHIVELQPEGAIREGQQRPITTSTSGNLSAFGAAPSASSFALTGVVGSNV